jgi:hypothetical protein
MKVFAFLVALAFFVGSFFLFGYAFVVGDGVNTLPNALMFFAGLACIGISLAIPFHLLETFD